MTQTSEKAQARPVRSLRHSGDEIFWSRCAAGELAIQRCGNCSMMAWPPREKCERCGSDDLKWNVLSGRGTLRSSCTFERAYFPECPPPWTTILVELDEGPLFIANYTGQNPAELTEGERLAVHFIRCVDQAGEFSLPAFARSKD